MRYRALAALIALPALAACCGGAGVTTGSKPHRKPPSNVIRVACPKGDRRKPVSRAHGADTALVPGHPRVALLCRYSGPNGHPRFALISQRKVTNSATVARLTRELNALPRPPSGA